MTSMRCFVFLLLCLGVASPSRIMAAEHVDPDVLAAAVATLGLGSASDVRQAVEALGASADPRALNLLGELAEGRLQVDNAAGVYRETPQGWRHVLTDQPPAPDAQLAAPSLTNALRRQLVAVRAQLQITSADAAQRLAGARAMADKPTPEAESALRTALGSESDPSIRHWLAVALAQLDLQNVEPSVRLEAVTVLGKSGRLGYRTLIAPLTGEAEADDAVRRAAVQALNHIDRQQWWVNQAANLFYGLSLGSILMLSALGLAITFGLMGVINMAHGEMLMLGAYTTYCVQRLLQSQAPRWEDGYLLVAIPAAFGVTALMGVALERLVIRHLYGRPLETLLATWGISLGLIQAVRLGFGAHVPPAVDWTLICSSCDLADGIRLSGFKG